MKNELKNEYHERNIRWTQTALNQLSFFNNLLLSLSVGFLAFCFEYEFFKNLTPSLKDIAWSKSFLIVSIILIVLSIIIGLIISVSRLKDFRITRAINQIRQRTYEHSDELLDESTPEKYKRIKRTFILFKKPPEITIEECKKYNEHTNFDFRFRELRNIAHNLGINSWNYTGYQAILFGFSIIFYLCSLIIN